MHFEYYPIIIPSLEEHPKMHPVVTVKKEKERKLSRAVDNCGSATRMETCVGPAGVF